MKRFFNHCLLVLAVIFATGCTTTPTGQVTASQSAIDATYTSYKALDQAILAADAAVRAGNLKGADAKRTLDGLTQAKAGLDVALVTLRAVNAAGAASGVSK